MRKIKLVSFGGCSGYDILTTDVSWRSKFSLTERYDGSVSRSFFKPGKIAARLYEEMMPLGNNFPNNSIKEKVRRQLSVIFKTFTVESILKTQTPNTIVIIDPSYELCDFYEKDDEAFDILGDWQDIKMYFPEWFRKEVAQNLCKFDMTGTRAAFQRLTNYRELFRLLEEHRCYPFFVDNVSSERVYVKELNSVAVNISLFCSKVSFLTANEKGEYTTLNFDYAIRCIDNLYNKLKDTTSHYYAENPKKHAWFPVERENCFTDPEHKWGYHPAHLHHLSRSTMSKKMHDAIIELYNDNVSIIK